MGRLAEFFGARNKPSTRRRVYLGPSMPRRIGPLEKVYDPIGLPLRMRCGDRIAQLIVESNRLRAAGDVDGFTANLPELRMVYDALHEPGWADSLFDELWPDWKDHEH